MIRYWWFLVLGLTAQAAVHFPVRFEPSEGGAFAVRVGTGAYWLTPSGSLHLAPGVSMQLQGANRSSRCLAADRLPGLTYDLRGADPARRRTAIPQYGRVICRQVYPGVDLSFHGSSGRLEYDFQLAPGASARQIMLDFAGEAGVHLSRKGELVVGDDGPSLRFLPPHLSQDGAPVSGSYRLLGRGRFGFRIGKYDRTRPLLIDPVLSLLAVFGTQNDPIQAIATDSSGNLYVAGSTTQAIPLADPANGQLRNCSAPPNVFTACQSLFVAKFDPTGTQLLYSTYLGDDQQDVASGLAVDGSGNAYVSATARPNLNSRDGQAFVIKLNVSGSALVYTRYLAGDTAASAIAVDAQGDAYLAGSSLAPDFPALNALQGPQPAQTLFVTHDGGVTWHSLNQGLPAPTIYWMTVDPTNSSTLYAGTSLGLNKSLDGGATWTRLLPAAQFVYQVVVDPAAPSTLYAIYGNATAAANQLAKSVDGGANWQVLTTAIPTPPLGQPLYIGSIAMDPSNPSTIWMATPFSVLESTDGGAHWTDVKDTGILGDSISAVPGGVLVDPQNSSRVYVCCTFDHGGSPVGLYKTTDGGKTWTESVLTGGQIGNWQGMALDPSNPSVVYVLLATHSQSVLYRSTDTGQTWRPVSLPANAPAGGYTGLIAVDPSGTLYLANSVGLLLRSPNGGANWSISQGPWGSRSQILVLDPTNPASTFYIGSDQGSNAIYQHAFAAKLDSSGSILWATPLAGSQQDAATSIAVDAMGNAYIGGYTNSTDFPVANPIQAARRQPSQSGEPYDAFVSKISVAGSRLIYSTYLGGSGNESINRIAVDGAANAYFAGQTDSSDFPTAQAFEASKPALGYTSFIGKIDPSGRKLAFSTYLNPYSFTVQTQYAPGDSSPAMAVDPQGGVWVAGPAAAVDFPLVNPIQSSLAPFDGSYVAKFNPSGGSLDFSTFLQVGSVSALALSPSGNVWLSGAASDPNFPSSATPGSGNGFFGRIDVEPLPPAQPGVPLLRDVFNAASWQVGDLVSPGELISLSGAELAPAAAPATALPLPQTLQGVRVTIGGMVAPLWYVSPTQINLQVPFELQLGSVQLVVQRGTQSSAPHALRVVPVTPGIFTFSGDGRTAPAVVHAADYSPVTAGNPARPGEYVTIFCTGLGVTAQSIPSGNAAPLMPVPVQAGLVMNGTVTYAGLAPGLSGVDQVNLQLSPTLSPGTVVISLRAGTGNSLANSVSIAVQ